MEQLSLKDLDKKYSTDKNQNICRKISEAEDVDSGTEIKSDSGHSSDDERGSIDETLNLDDDSSKEEPPVVVPRKKSIKKQVSNFLHVEKLLSNEYNLYHTEKTCPFVHQNRELECENEINETKIYVEPKLEKPIEPKIEIPLEPKIEINKEQKIGIDIELNTENANEPKTEITIESTKEVVIDVMDYTPNVIVDNLSNEEKEMLKVYQEGFTVAVDKSVSLDDVPEWLDIEKFKRGQKFAMDHIFCVNFADMLSLFMLFSVERALEPLIFSGQSHTPFKSYKRYLSTFIRLKSWYEDDIWNKDSQGRKNLSIVKALHNNIKQKLDEAEEDTLRKNSTLGDEQTTAIWCPLRKILQDDFSGSIPKPVSCCPYQLDGKVWVSQSDMAFTQFGFVGLLIAYPEAFGCAKASADDLAAFVHVWRVLGFMLGIKDKYNFCQGDLETVKSRSIFIMEHMIKPSLRNPSSDWEHMCRCVTEGISYYIPGVTFEVSLLYLCDTLKIYTPRLKKSMSYLHHFLYFLSKLLFHYGLYIPNVLSYNNNMVLKLVQKAQKVKPEQEEKLRNKSYDYMKQTGKVQIKP